MPAHRGAARARADCTRRDRRGWPSRRGAEARLGRPCRSPAGAAGRRSPCHTNSRRVDGVKSSPRPQHGDCLPNRRDAQIGKISKSFANKVSAGMVKRPGGGRRRSMPGAAPKRRAEPTFRCCCGILHRYGAHARFRETTGGHGRSLSRHAAVVSAMFAGSGPREARPRPGLAESRRVAEPRLATRRLG